MTIHQPLDLEYWFVNVFAGSFDIFLFLLVILIAGLAAKFRMSNLSFGIILLCMAILLSISYPWLLVLAISLTGLGVYYTFTKLFR